MTLKLKKVARGWYATDDGTWAVIGDNPNEVATVEENNGSGIQTGCSTQREWQIVFDSRGQLRESHLAGNTVEWVDTLTQGRTRLAKLIETKKV